MNPALIEELLNEEEGVALDFKEAQYLFIKATDEQKGELLKDILAFANARRQTDAYILVGVKEVKGGRSEIVGITSNFDDASIQQFVNKKTNRNIEFSYKTITVDGKIIGVFHIPLQERPFYLKRGFGKLKEEKVYIRRSSSTDEAGLDEISKMGGSQFSDIQSISSKLDIEILDVYLVKQIGWEKSKTQFMTIELQVVNTKAEDNSIKKSRLFVTKGSDVIEGEYQQIPFVKTSDFPNSQTMIGIARNIVFSQGVLRKYKATFLFNNEPYEKHDFGENLNDKNFVLEITDSYNQVYKIEGKTSENLIKESRAYPSLSSSDSYY